MDYSLHLTFSWAIFIFSLIVLIGLPFFCGFAYRANFKNYIVGMAVAVLVHLAVTKLPDLNTVIPALGKLYESARYLYLLLLYAVTTLIFGLFIWLGIRFLGERRFGYAHAFTVGAGFAGTFCFLNYGLRYRSNASALTVFLQNTEAEYGMSAEEVEDFRQRIVETFSQSPYQMMLDLLAILYMSLVFIAVTLLIANGTAARNRRLFWIGVGAFYMVNVAVQVAALFSAYIAAAIGVLLSVGAVLIIREQSGYEVY